MVDDGSVRGALRAVSSPDSPCLTDSPVAAAIGCQHAEAPGRCRSRAGIARYIGFVALCATVLAFAVTPAKAQTVSTDPLWSADMSVVDFGNGSIGAWGAGKFSNVGGSGDLEAKWLWYHTGDRKLHLAFTTAIEDTTGLSLYMGDMAVEFSDGGNDSGFTWTDLDVAWTDGETIPVHIAKGGPLVVTPANASPTGAPAILGTPQVGETLTATISDIEDGDGLDNVVFAYQWLANDGTDDTEIEGANGTTHEVAPAQVGKTLKVRVTFTDDAGNEETLVSAATDAVAARSPALSVADADGHEGADATVAFAVTLDRAATAAVTVDYATADGTATAGDDYTATSGTLTFAPGETAKTVSVPIIDDTVDDSGETFTLVLSNASGAVLADAEATGTILNTEADTTPPTLVGQEIRFTQPVLQFSEDLVSFPRPDTSAFAVTVDGVTRSVASLVINVEMGTVKLRLPLPVQSGETTVISYTPPATNVIRDLAGNAAAAFSVTIPASVTATAPGAPRNLAAKAGTAQVTLTWSTPDNGGKTITGYEYRQREGTNAFGAWTAVPNSGPNTRSYTVGSLTSDTEYTFEVWAKNGAGTGAASSVSATPSATETVPPALTTAFRTDDDLRLVFDEVLDGDSVPDSSAFAVTVDGVSSNVIDVVVDGEHRTVRLQIAALFIFYQRIAISYTPPATKAIQDLAGNAAVAFTTKAFHGGTTTAPDAPRELQAESGDGDVTLTWRKAYDGGATIIGYEYRQQEGVGAFGNWMSMPNSGPYTETHTVSGLSNGTQYTFEVRADNGADKGPAASASATPATLAPLTDTVPRAPEFTGFLVDDGKLTVVGGSLKLGTLVPGDRVSEVVSSFKVQWKSGSQEYDSSRQETLASTPGSAGSASTVTYIPSYAIMGLTNGTEYTVRIIAVNTHGDSPSSVEKSGTPNAKPDQLREYIEDEIVKKNENSYPWLRHTWDYMTNNNVRLNVRNYGASKVSRVCREGQGMASCYVSSMTIAADVLDGDADAKKWTILHELAHVYTLANGVSSTPAPLAMAHLYFDSLNGQGCASTELYADILASLVLGGSTTSASYWNNCAGASDSAAALAVVRSAAGGQAPSWFATTYNDSNGDPDLEQVWADLIAMGPSNHLGIRDTQRAVAYQLRDQFGGYCDTQVASRAIREEGVARAATGNPWKDGGCVPDAPTSLSTASGGSGQVVVSWNAPASDGGSRIGSYKVQWKSGEEEYSPARTEYVRYSLWESYRPDNVARTVTELTDGTEYTFRVLAHNLNGDGAAAEESATPSATDDAAPELLTATVLAAQLVLIYSEALDETSTPAASAYVVTVGSVARSVDDVSVGDSAVTLTLNSKVAQDDAVTVSYTVPTDDNAPRVQDSTGNDAAAISGQTVINNTPPVSSDATLETVNYSYRFQPCEHDRRIHCPRPHGGLGTYSSNISKDVDSSIETISFWPRPASDQATVAYSPVDADATADGYQLSLSPGDNVATITVTAEDGVTTKTYSITVNRTNNRSASGLVAITGTVRNEETLTATLFGIVDLDGLTDPEFEYQWISNDGATDTNIESATNSTYTLVATDIGKTIKVRVTFEDDAGHTETLTSAATVAVEATVMHSTQGEPEEPLTATFDLVPGTHDGASTFAFELRFSEEIAVTDAAMRDDVLEVSGGSVTSAERLDAVSTRNWTITIEPEGDADLFVFLTTGRACEETGAICTSGGKRLRTGLIALIPHSVPVANTPPSGLLTITGTPEVGEVLTASVDGIVDEDGLDGVTFAYQWLAHDGTEDTEIAGATGAKHEVAPAEVGKALKVRVTFTDEGGTEEALVSVATEAVSAREPDAPGGLAAATAVGREGELTVSWTAPASDGGAEVTGYKVQWKSGTEAYDASAFSTRQAVLNDPALLSHTITDLTVGTTYTVRVLAVNAVSDGVAAEVEATAEDRVAPTLTAASVNGTALTLTFSEALSAASKPAADAFAVSVEGAARTVDAVARSGSAVELTLASAVASGEMVTVSYTLPAGANATPLKDAAGNAATSFTGEAVTNETPAPAILPEVSIRAGAAYVQEGSDAVFTLTRSGPVAGALTVSVAIEESGTMLAGKPLASVAFAAGVAEVELAVPTVDDETQEPDSAVTVRVVAGTGYGPWADLASASVTVLDDDAASAVSAAETLWSADMQVAEITSVSLGAARADLFSNQSGSAGLQAKELWYFTPTRMLKLKFTGAIPDAEGLTLHVGDVAIPLPAGSGGEWGATWNGVDIDWTDGQTLSVRLTAQSADTVPADASLKSLTVAGGELSPGFDPSELVYRAVVGSGTESVTVSAAVNDGSATLAIEPEVDADPDAADHQVAVPYGETLIAVTVTAEDGETQRRYRVVAIRAPPALTVSFGSASYTATEGGDAAAVAVVLSGDPGRAVTIPLTAVAGGGADADDYVAPASVTFESGGALTRTATVTAAADETAESGESAVLGFGTLPEGIEAGATASATVMLADAAPANTAPTGLPAISGTPKVGETLTASISDIEDEDGLDNATFAYQWLANYGTDDTEIAGATGSTHEVGPAEVGKRLKVRATFTDDGDTEETLTSVATEAVAARAPDAPGGLAAATAAGREGELDVTWTAPASDGGSEVTDYKVQWKSGSEAYDGSASSTRQALVSDPAVLTHTIKGLTVGTAYTVRVLAVNDAGDGAAAEVEATAEDRVVPTLTAAAVNGTALTLTFSEALDEDSKPAADAFAATVAGDARTVDAVALSGSAVELTLASAVTSGETVTVGYTAPAGADAAPLKDAAGNDAASFAGEAVTNDTQEPENAAPAGLPEISGTSQVGEELTASADAITDADGTDNATFAYQWLANDGTDDSEIAGATGATYTVTPAEAGSTLKVRATFTDDKGTEEVLTSAPTEPVAAVAPDAPGGMAVATAEGRSRELTVSWTAPASDGGAGVTGYRVQWKSGTEAYDGSEASTRQAVLGDAAASHTITGLTVGTAYAVRVLAVNAAGAGAAAEAEATVQDRVVPALASASVDGTILTLTYNEALDATSQPAAGAFAVSVDGSARAVDAVALSGSAVALTLASAVAAEETVTAGYTVPAGADAAPLQDASGNAAASFAGESVSNDTPAPENAAPAGLPEVSGTAEVGETLTASVSAIEDEDGLDNATFVYQWLANDGTDDSEIAGATNATWEVAPEQAGKTLKVRVTFSDDKGNEETLTSAATDTVVDRRPVAATLSVGAGAAEAGRFRLRIAFGDAVTGLAPADVTASRVGGDAAAVSELAEADTGRAWTAWVAADAGRYTVRLAAGAAASGERQSLAAVLAVDVDAAGNATAVAGPVVTSVGLATASDGTWTAGETVRLSLTFSEPVTVSTDGGTPTVGVALDGTARQASYRSGGGRVAVFTYRVTADDGTVSAASLTADSLALNGGTIRDAAGRDADLEHPGIGEATEETETESAAVLTGLKLVDTARARRRRSPTALRWCWTTRRTAAGGLWPRWRRRRKWAAWSWRSRARRRWRSRTTRRPSRSTGTRTARSRAGGCRRGRTR